MNKKNLLWTAVIAALSALLSIALLDRHIAIAVHSSAFEHSAFFVQGTRLLDAVSGRSLLHQHTALSALLLGGALLALGITWALVSTASHTARALVFTSIVQLTTVLSAGAIKNIFGRLRPYEIFAQGNWDHWWFAGGNSFPSGHNAFFWGLFLPLAYLFPKYRIPLLVIPVFIACARIDDSDHFLSDVLGSIALAALITLIAAWLLGRWVRPVESKHK